MATYSVYNRPGGVVEKTVFVKEGFSWAAFLVTFLWCLRHRMWGTAAAMLAVFATIQIAGGSLGLGEAMTGLAALAASVIVGLEASELRRFSLLFKGYSETGIVSGDSFDDAELRYFVSAAGYAVPARIASPTLRPHKSQDPLGLFGTA